jgi:hypothetical protein
MEGCAQTGISINDLFYHTHPLIGNWLAGTLIQTCYSLVSILSHSPFDYKLHLLFVQQLYKHQH